MLPEFITDKTHYLDIIKNNWLAAGDTFPDFLSEISDETKLKNEQYIITLTADLQKHFNCFPRLPIGRKKWRQKVITLIKDFLYQETIINIHNCTDQIRLDAFLDEIFDFLRQVRKFAPELSFEDIGQAIRNYVVYVMFKEINLIQTGFSMAGFGYSMLYPFTDNYIDSINYSSSDKVIYNQIIRDKIEGKEVFPKSIHHRKTCDLLQAIASDYSNDQSSHVSKLLLMMLEAQEKSIIQQKQDMILTHEERLDITIEKGGISVLIDRFLINKECTKDDLIFYLGVGFFLQLADDLQDIKSDYMQGYQTVFTDDLNSEHEEKLVHKMLYFIHDIMVSYQADNDHFKNFILSNCYQLIYTSVIGSKEFFSDEFLDKIGKRLPVSYTFYEQWRKNLIHSQDIKIQKKHRKLLDGLLFS